VIFGLDLAICRPIQAIPPIIHDKQNEGRASVRIGTTPDSFDFP
jgi:hypothetical protein